MSKKIPINIKEAIRRVNESLRYYEAEWVSLQRSPYSEKERIHTLRQYLDCRINMEFYSIPELEGIVESFGGHLMEVVSVIGINDKKRRFEYATATINRSPTWYYGEENYLEVIKKVEEAIGGDTIKFTHSPKRPKITITK